VIPSDGTVKIIGDFAFADCGAMTSIEIPDCVKVIDKYAFVGCKALSSVTIPEGTRVIGYAAFRACSSLSSVSIPDSIEYLDDWVFEDCDSLVYNSYDNAFYLGNAENPYVALIKAVDDEIASCEINENTKIIYGDSFDMCRNLRAISIPEGVRMIGGWSFYECTSLESVEIPEGVTVIGDFAFCYCTSLEWVRIPASMKVIGWVAFDRCISLKDVYYPDVKSAWDRIDISIVNDPLLNAEIHFLCDEHTEHCWDVGKVILAATYKKDGMVVYTCEECGATRTEVIPMLISDIRGDANGDAEVTMKDVLLLRRYIAGLSEIDSRFAANADLDGNCEFTMNDVMLLRRIIAGLEE
jgi:hypothetical protein